MGWVAGAMAVGSIASGVVGASAAGSAADVQAAAASHAADIQQQMYNQTRSDLSPFVRLGTGAMNNLASLIPGGLQLAGANPNTFTSGQVPDDPSNPKFISTAGPGGESISVPNPNYDPSKPNPNAPAGFELTPNNSPSQFLTGLQSLLPGSGNDPSLQALNSLTPGAKNADPLMTAVRDFIPGATDNTNPLTSAVYNFIPGASDTPDASLSALRGFIPGGGTENGLLQQLNAMMGVGTSPAQQAQRLKDLSKEFGTALGKSGLSQEEYLKTPAGQSYAQERNGLIGSINDPELLRQFAFSDQPDAAALAKTRLDDVISGKAKTDDAAASGAKIQAALEATPGYQFTRDQGLKSVQNSYAAKGLGNSGAALRGAADYATGLSNQTYEARLADYLNTYNSQFTNTQNAYNSQFSNTLNAGNTQFTNALNAYGKSYDNALNSYNSKFTNSYNAYGQQLGAAQNLVSGGQNAAAQVGTIGQGTSQAIGNTLTQGAAAQAAGIVGGANAVGNAISGVANAGASAYMFGPGGPGANALTSAAAAKATGLWGRS